jgi:hypothetical protein
MEMIMINASENNFVSIGGKRRRMERASRLGRLEEVTKMVDNVENQLVELGKRKRFNNDVIISNQDIRVNDVSYSYKKRRLLDNGEVDYEIVEAETRVENARLMSEMEEKENAKKQQLWIKNQHEIQKKKREMIINNERRLRYKFNKIKKQQMANEQWLIDQNKQRTIAAENADYEELRRELQRQRTVAYTNMCIESNEWLSEQKRLRQMAKVFANAEANEFMCEQKRIRLVTDKEAEMKDIMSIQNKC